MKALKNFMHARRPIELVLAGIVILLLTFGAWTLLASKQSEDALNVDDPQPVNVQGTPREIDATTENELVDTTLIENDTAELEGSDLYDSAADNFGGVYDESSY